MFVDQSVTLPLNHQHPQTVLTGHPQPILTGSPQTVLTEDPQPILIESPQPVLTRGKHGRHTPTQASPHTSTFSTPVRAKRRLFLRSETISDKTLLAISKEVCSKYVDLGIELDLPHSTVESTTGAVGASKPEHLKAYYVLQSWKQRAGSDFTFTVLARALEDIGLATVAQNHCYIGE